MSSKTTLIALFVLLFTAISSDLCAQNQAKRVYNTAFAKTAPEIDGQMNDPCWEQVEWSGDFIQIQPYENKAPSQQTSFKVLYDDDNLYILVRAFDSEPDKISRRISRRDNFDGDMVSVAIDSYYDQQTAFSFTAMASGAKGDEAVTQDGNNWDESWNPIWFLKTSIDDKGWCAEMKIPFSQLRFGKKTEHIWGIQVMRHIFRLEERSTWQFIPKGSPGQVHLYGELHGINDIKPKRKVELLPYTVARTERFAKDGDNPFLNGKKSAFSAGLDGKAAITNDLTLDFSINPDFGQVEADPSEVNLSAFESYFSERRPFFVEGKNIYEFEPSNSIVIHNMGADNLFYSRRIGRYPHNSPDLKDNEYADIPEATTILGAMKLSGKTKKGLSIGVLESVTANENAVIDNNGERRKESVEPLTNYFVGRLQQDFNKGETVLGGIVTAVNRDITNPALDYLPTEAYTGGLDFSRNWKERTWYFNANTEFSFIKGKPEAMIAAQRSSARYYQRPDASYVTLDSSRTSLSGFGGTFKFGRSSKKRLQFETSLTLRSPGLEFNDIGYMRYSDVIHHGSWVAYYLRDPFSIFNNFYLNTNYWAYWNFSGEMLSAFTNMNFNTQFKNKWRLNGNITRCGENKSTNLLRGGPTFILPGTLNTNINIQSNRSRKMTFYVGSYQGFGDVKSFRNQEYWAGADYKPMNSLLLSFSPSFGVSKNELQYVSENTMNTDPRYVFAYLDQKTMSFTFRLNYTFTPELSLEYYGQPFVSAGKYTKYKRVTAPKAERFRDRYRNFTAQELNFDAGNNSYLVDENRDGTTDYSFDNPDFNFRQFRSNLVVRWEYSPGSTLFLVWSQGRTDSVTDGSFDYGRDMKGLFGVTPHNVFLIKFSYWFSV
jgi:hypothetical protein